MKRFISLLLVFCLVFTMAFAEEEKPKSFWDSVGGWFSNAAEDAATWASQTWASISRWVVQAWNDSSKWVSQAWKDSSNWVNANWDHLILWINDIVSGEPYDWIQNVVLDNGILAYDKYVELRSFLNDRPDTAQLREKYDAVLSKLSILNEDKDILWDMLQQWTEEKGLSIEQTAELALPFAVRLLIEGESVIGDGTQFSGPVVGQYLIAVLEALHLDSAGKANVRMEILQAELDQLTRPTIIGDTDQNVLVTEDHTYIENFTYGNGKYQIIMTASMCDEDSRYPLLRGLTLKQAAQKYFETAEYGESAAASMENDVLAESLPFHYAESETNITGKAVALWTQNHYYLFFMVTDQEWQEEEFNAWLQSISLTDSNTISLEVDMASDGAFYGINQSAQKYTIRRVMDEARFMVPKTGHGWAAERGNNLIDNIKGLFTGSHSTIVGDNNVKNGADRVTTFSDGSRILIQSKYYSTAARSIASCFDENGFRYIDHVDGKPMSIEVPSDQYDAALEYMKHRIANGEVPGVTSTDQAVEIVKKGNLTYQQARHIAKAGTVESILYDSAHSCVTAGASMGISAVVSFAVNLWNGESVETSIKESILQGLRTGGTSFIISVLSSQLAKSGLNTAMIPASKVIAHALGPKVSAVIVNAFRPAGSAIYGAAAMQSAAKLLRGNIITAAVSFVVLSANDVSDIIQGKISWKQLAKNASTTAAGIIGGALGFLGGAALGSAILPGAGTVVGIIVSIATGWGANEGAKAIADLIAEDDADEMIEILENQFAEIASEYFLNEDEVNQAIENLQALISAKMLKEMYQYRDHQAFARQLIEMAIDPVVAQRPYVKLPSEEEYSNYLTEVLQAIYEDINDETVTEE